jgi:hypothetical protein
MKKIWSPAKEILFTYLAITKIIYWYNTITAMDAGMGEAVMSRLLYQDAIIILAIISLYYLDKRIAVNKSKYSNILEHILFYVIGFVAVVGVSLIYQRLMFGPLQIDTFGAFMRAIGNFVVGYSVIIIAFNAKSYFKAKVKPEKAPSAQNTGDKLVVLNDLLDDGTLTPEEFEKIKNRLPE